MSIITENLMPCLGSHNVLLRKTTVHILQIYLRFSSDVQAVIRYKYYAVFVDKVHGDATIIFKICF